MTATTPPPPPTTLPLTVEFTGGLEMLFSHRRTHTISLPAPQPPTVAHLITWLCTHLLRDPRRELFVLDDGTIRPGILVLVNDADWELEGRERWVLAAGDRVVFVSTLHGG